MSANSEKRLKAIWFESELLPHWARLLDVAAKLSPVPAETCQWFSKFANGAGVDDARAVIDQCNLLRSGLRERRERVLRELQRTRADDQPSRIYGGWIYALDTMIQAARGRKTCSWVMEGGEEQGVDDTGGGDITLRRV